MIEYAYTGGKMQGGGEYMTFQDSWDTAQKSTKYMTDVYAANAFKAFQARSTAEVGTEVCKSFIGTRYPTNIDKLLEPDSPVQFHSWFDEIPYTDATYPATSQYKVYYNIFSGRDSGHYYSVYLKNPPQTAYYSSQPYIVVETGYVGIGQSIDKTKDFTAPAGYKELCVRIDTTEKCGFKSVSTSMALQLIKDNYAKEQATEEITNEKDCVAGTPSLYSLAQPNIQEGTAGIVQPALYKSGVIRICSTDDPGARTNPGRWTSVGYCDSNKGIKCWLDKNSVENVVKDLGIENNTLKNAEKIANKEKLENKEIFDEAESTSRIAEIEKKYKSKDFELIKKVDIPDRVDKIKEIGSPYLQKLMSEIEELKEKAYFNNQRAQAYFIEFKIYKALTEKLLKEYVPLAPVKIGIEEEIGGTGSGMTDEEAGITTGIGGGLEGATGKGKESGIAKVAFLVGSVKIQENQKIDSSQIIEIKHSCDIMGYTIISKAKIVGGLDRDLLVNFNPTKNTIKLKRFISGKYVFRVDCFDFSGRKLDTFYSPEFNFENKNVFNSKKRLESIQIAGKSYISSDGTLALLIVKGKTKESVDVTKSDTIKIILDYDYAIYEVFDDVGKMVIGDYLSPEEENTISLTKLNLKEGETYTQSITAYESFSGRKINDILIAPLKIVA